jgi:hypothetical protein
MAEVRQPFAAAATGASHDQLARCATGPSGADEADGEGEDLWLAM